MASDLECMRMAKSMNFIIDIEQVPWIRQPDGKLLLPLNYIEKDLRKEFNSGLYLMKKKQKSMSKKKLSPEIEKIGR